MKKEAKFAPELLSINAFRELATLHSLHNESVEAIVALLKLIYDAESLAERFNGLLRLSELLSPLEQNEAASKLLYQSLDFIQLILGAATRADITQRLAERELRTPFQPHFLFNAPRDAQLRGLLDALADWHQETDLALKKEKLEKIASASSYNHNKPSQLKPRRYQSEFYSQIPERRMFNALSIAHNMRGVFISRTSKLARKDYQDYEYKEGIREASSMELEEKRVLPLSGRLYKMNLKGSDDDRCLKVSYFSTKDCVAHEVHYGEAAFVVTISGDIFVEPIGNIGTRFSRNPFFAGRISVDNEGRLKSYNNFSECFDHDERNLLCLTRHFHDINLIGDHNPGVVAGLVRQREFVGDQEAFKRYAQQFDAFALWQANENLFSISKSQIFLPNKESIQKLEQDAIEEQQERLQKLRTGPNSRGPVPAWLANWEQDLGNPQHTFPPVVDHLATDPVNLHGFSAAKEKAPDEPSYQLRLCNKPAQDDPAAGIHHDFDQGIRRIEALNAKKKLQHLRRKIKLRDRLDTKKLRCVFVGSRPNDHEIGFGVIYFYPHHASDNYISYCLLLEAGNRDMIHESQLATSSTGKSKDLRLKLKQSFQIPQSITTHPLSKRDEKELKELVLRLRHFEKILMTSPHKLPCDSAEKMRAIKAQVQANVSIDVAMTFFEELRVFDRRQQVNNFFGRMYLFYTNREIESESNRYFDPSNKDYLAKITLPPINHYDQRDWVEPENHDSDDDSFTPGPLKRQSTYF